MSDEFGIDDAVLEAELNGKGKAKKDKPAPVIADEKVTAKKAAKGEDLIEIIIDEPMNATKDSPNFTPVGINGYIYKIKHGEPVKVPPSVVSALENTIATRTIQTENRATGEVETRYQNYSAIPWRRTGR